MVRFLVSVPDGLHKALKEAASERGYTLTGFIRQVLWEWAERTGQQTQARNERR